MPGCLQNDLITLSPHMLDAHLMKLSITFALAQSTKLSVLEVGGGGEGRRGAVG